MFQIFFKDLIEIQESRLPVYKRNHDHAVIFLQLCMLIKAIQRDPRVGVTFQLDDDTHAVTVGFITNSTDAFYSLVLDQLADLFQESGLVDLEWDLSNNNLRFATFCFFNVSDCTH